MEVIGILIAALVVFWGLGIIQAPFIIWLTAFFVSILSLYINGSIATTNFIILSILTAILFLVIVINPIRKKLTTKVLYNWGKKTLPTMSSTEREAIGAGETWFEAELFKGKPNWKEIFDMPKAKLSKDEKSFLENQVNTLCKMLDDWQITNGKKDLPKEVWDYLKQEKFFALLITKKYGGLEFSSTANSLIVQKIASKSISASVTVMVPNSLGPAELLLKYGTEDQKQEYLPKLATGEHIPCFGLTSLEAGSDASNMVDSGVVCNGIFDGEEVLGIKLSWEKRYITLAPVATLLGIAFKLFDPEGLLGKQQELGITVALIPTKVPGVEVGERHLPLTMAFMNGPTRGKDVFIPLEYIIGGKNQIGKGWRMLVECLSVGRGISLPALATASSIHAFKTTGAYCAIRRQFNLPIGKFEGVQEVMARIGANAYMCKATSLFVTAALDRKIKPSVVTAITKYHLTEYGRRAINDAMDIHGGKGIISGPTNYLARAFESIPISITVEGANILTRNLIIFGQGAIRCHPYIKDEMAALQDEDLSRGLEFFDKSVFAHIGFMVNNFARLSAHLVTFGVFYKTPGECRELNKYFKLLGKYSLALAAVSDVSLIILGGNLKRKETLSARLGDVLSNLFVASAVIKYYQETGSNKEDLVFVKWSLDYLLFEIENAFYKFFDNFPNKLVSTSLKLLVMPFGRVRRYPKDSQNAQIAEIMQAPSKFRDRINEYLFKGSDDDMNKVIEESFNRYQKLKPIYKGILKQQQKGKLPSFRDMDKLTDTIKKQKILSDSEITELVEFEKLKVKLIGVDSFKQQEINGH